MLKRGKLLYWTYRRVADKSRFILRLTRSPQDLSAMSARVLEAVPANDEQLVRRLVSAYRRTASSADSSGESMWQSIFREKQQDIHEVLIEEDFPAIAALLRNPAQSDLFYGFEGTTRSDLATASVHPDFVYGDKLILDTLLRLAEAVGVRRLANPESWSRRAHSPPVVADEIIDELENHFGFQLEIPNIFPGEFGILTRRGVISWRVPQALFQAWRISRLVAGIENPRVLEIGGGLGRTAFYCRRFGISDYTTIDIPITSLAQGYFLGRTMGEDKILLIGEQADDPDMRVKLLPPTAFLDGSDRYDLVASVDSLTEIDRSVASSYISAILARADIFLSINHEANPFTVRELLAETDKMVEATRAPYWLRQGYVEEIVLRDPSAPSPGA